MAVEMAELTRSALIGELEELHQAVRELMEPLSDQEIWAKPVEPGNSIGHLVLHLTGNLNHFVGAQLGGTGYVRDREREFTQIERPAREELLAGLAAAVATFRNVVDRLNADQLSRPHPEARLGTVCKALIHVVAHFAVHRGQMSYLARLLKARRDLAAPISPS